MSRYIDAEAAKIDAAERGGTLWLTDGDVKEVKRFLDDQPTADVAPVIHSQWERGYGYNAGPVEYVEYITCPNCNNTMIYSPMFEMGFLPDYCPHCGAKMDKGNDK